MKRLPKSLLLALLGLFASETSAWAVAIPILDPGFNFYLANTLTEIPERRFAEGGGGPAEDVPLRIATGQFTGELGDIPAGWSSEGNLVINNMQPNRGRYRHSPSGIVTSHAYIAEVDDIENGVHGRFWQTLTGVTVQPNTVYTLSAELSDRDSFAEFPEFGEDLVAFPPAATVHVDLYAGTFAPENKLAGVVSFTPPPNGGTSTYTHTITTGAVVPAGDLMISLMATGSSTGGQYITTQSFFDNVTLDATSLNVGLTGDHNGDETVDAADYVAWRKTDIDGPLGYTDWRTHFGESSLGSGGSVPEPSGLIALVIGGLLALGWLRPKSRAIVTVHANTRTRSILLGLLALVAPATSAWAVPVPILDPGFDMYLANTLTSVPDNRLLNIGTPGAGSGPLNDAPLIDFNTFQPIPGVPCDVPAGWTVTGQKPAGTNNTSRIRIDAGFDAPPGSPPGYVAGVVANINSFGADFYEDPANPGTFIRTPGLWTQILAGVTVQPNTLYTATIEVSDIDIEGLGPFGAEQPDNIIVGDPARIILSLSAVDSTTGPPTVTNLGGVLEFTEITPGGFGTPEAFISGGKELLTLTVLTGETVPAGNLTIAFEAGGALGPYSGFGGSSQTFFDNVALDATPFNVGLTGDHNGDETVDAADYVTWRKTNIDGPQGYTDWQTHFGESTLGSGGGLGDGVPEPSGLIALVTGGMFALGCVRLQGHRHSP